MVSNLSMSINDAAQLYYSLSKHFNSKHYDYFKYNGKLSFKPGIPKPAVYWLSKLAKHKDPKGLLIANMVDDPSRWIKQIVGPEGQQPYAEWQKRTQSLTYMFNADLQKMPDHFDSLFVCSPTNQLPLLVRLVEQKQVMIETACILISLLELSPYWAEHCTDKQYNKFAMCVDKYTPFIEFNPAQYRKLVLDSWKERVKTVDNNQ